MRQSILFGYRASRPVLFAVVLPDWMLWIAVYVYELV